MKIAIFTDVFLPKVDGIVTSLEQLILELDRQGHEVLVVAPSAKGGPKKLGKKAQILYLPSIPAFVYPDWRLGLLSLKLNKTFKDFSPDIVQIPTLANVGMMGIFLARAQSIPLVGVFHVNFMKPEYLQLLGIKRGTRFVESLGWKFAKLGYSPCVAIISPSESVKKELTMHNFPNPLFVCPNGLQVDTEATNLTAHNKFKKKWNIDPTKTFLYVGRLSKEKNVKTLVKVFHSVHAKDPDTKLLLVGDGPEREELEEMVRHLNLQKNILFAGEIKHDELFKLGIFKMARAFVSCSTSEVQPMSMIEALFYGLPIITSLSQGMVDLVENGKSGYLVKPNIVAGFATKMLKLINDEKVYALMSENSKKMSQRFTIEHTTTCYLSLFNKIIAGEKLD